MAVDRGIERRVDRLENEAVAIYDLIKDETRDIRGTLSEHTQTLHEHGQALAEILRRLPEQDRTLAEILRRLPEPS